VNFADISLAAIKFPNILCCAVTKCHLDVLIDCYRLLAHIHLLMKHCLDRYIYLFFLSCNAVFHRLISTINNIVDKYMAITVLKFYV